MPISIGMHACTKHLACTEFAGIYSPVYYFEYFFQQDPMRGKGKGRGKETPGR